jgi:Sap, sulfolipid-1-addressing protein
MWGTVLMLALVATADPVRLGISVLLSSRPRPVRHLVACWLGGVAVSVGMALGVLFVLRDFALGVVHRVDVATSSPTAGHVQIAMGVSALLIATFAMGLSPRSRSRVPRMPRMSLTGTGPSHLQVLTSTAFSRLSTHAAGALQAKPLRTALLAGAGLATDLRYLAALTAIVASGAATGTQLTAAAVYSVVSLGFLEIPLISQLTAPAKTSQAVSAVHGWVKVRRQQVFGMVIAVLGVFLMTSGMGVS